MRNLRFLLAPASLLALATCGDNEIVPDAPMIDAREDVIPPEPELGMQIDRLGRPAIAAILVGLRDTSQLPKWDRYNTASDPATWAATELATGRTIAGELAEGLALLDVLDQGNPSIPVPEPTGCGNQVLFNGTPSGGGVPGASSYQTLATILADDMLYVDTSKATCTAYFALELDAATGGGIPHMQCGGRTPTHDVIDISYSALISGLNGFTNPPGLIPRISDGVGPHTDLNDTMFPYFGPPR